MLEVCQTRGCKVLGKLGRISRYVKIVGSLIMGYVAKDQVSILLVGRRGISREIAPSCNEDPAKVQCSRPYLLLFSHPILGW